VYFVLFFYLYLPLNSSTVLKIIGLWNATLCRLVTCCLKHCTSKIKASRFRWNINAHLVEYMVSQCSSLPLLWSPQISYKKSLILCLNYSSQTLRHNSKLHTIWCAQGIVDGFSCRLHGTVFQKTAVFMICWFISKLLD
jgi:hypothetical protein